MLFVLYKGTYIIVHILLLLLKIITNFQQNLTTTNNLLQCHLVYVVKLLRRIVGVKDTVLSLKETPNKLLWLYALLMARLLTDVCKILESVLILPTCGNLEILFLPVCHWGDDRYFWSQSPYVFAPKSAKLTHWALGIQEFMHADSNIFHTSVIKQDLIK